ncbi:hypothetical protein ACVPOS_10585 [Staphylococcus aureus]
MVNFSSRFANVSVEDFVENYIIKNNVKEVIAGFDFTFGKFGKGRALLFFKNMMRLIGTIVSKQEIENEKI